MTSQPATARGEWILLLVLFILGLWVKSLPGANATSVTCLNNDDVVATSAFFCHQLAPCRDAYYLSGPSEWGGGENDYDRRLFRFLYAQRLTSLTLDESAQLALCPCLVSPDVAMGNETCSTVVRVWMEVLALHKPCGVNEEFVLDVGCRCRHGARCPSEIDADGVGVHGNDRLFVRLLLAGIFAAVVISSVVLLSRTKKLNASVGALGKHE